MMLLGRMLVLAPLDIDEIDAIDIDIYIHGVSNIHNIRFSVVIFFPTNRREE